MKAKTVWTEKMKFLGDAGEHSVMIDAKSPIGSGSGLTPKELILIGLCGCTAMDVVALMRKYKQQLDGCEVSVNAGVSADGVFPSVFSEFQLNYVLKGSLDREKVKEAVVLSQSKYCGVSAMLAKAAPIRYRIEINGVQIYEGIAAFESKQV